MGSGLWVSGSFLSFFLSDLWVSGSFSVQWIEPGLAITAAVPLDSAFRHHEIFTALETVSEDPVVRPTGACSQGKGNDANYQEPPEPEHCCTPGLYMTLTI